MGEHDVDFGRDQRAAAINSQVSSPDHRQLTEMGQAIGQILSFGVAVALSPVPIIAVVLMLATPKGRVNGPVFLVGWMFGLGATGAVLLLAASSGGASTSGKPADWVGVVKIVGVLFLLLALRQWRWCPRGDAKPKLPWVDECDRLVHRTKGRRDGGAALGGQPEEPATDRGAAAAIAQTGTSTGDQAVALAVFVLLGTLGPGIPVAIYFLMGKRAAEILESLRGWMVRENATIMTVLCLIIGAKLIGDAITALAS